MDKVEGKYVSDAEARAYLKELKDLLLQMLENNKGEELFDGWNDMMRELQAITILTAELDLRLFPLSQLILTSISSIKAGPEAMEVACKAAVMSISDTIFSA